MVDPLVPQMPLALRFASNQNFENFIAGPNQACVAALRAVSESSSSPWLFLHGPEGAGKSHLLLAACAQVQNSQPWYLPLHRLAEHAEAALMSLQPQGLICIDDVEAIAGKRGCEIALFDVFNRARSAGAVMLFAASKPPAHCGIDLPDLISRLSSCTQMPLKALSENEKRDVVQNRAQARGFTLDESVLEFLFRRHSRDLGVLLALVDRLDQASLAAQKRVTVPFLRKIIGLPSNPVDSKT